MVRGLAALAVCLGHWRNLFLVDYSQVSDPNLFVKFLFFITGFGRQAVIIFFVLSGFFISRSILKAKQDRCWSWKWYLTARLSRLLIVLIPALVLGAFWDRLGIELFGVHSIYGGNRLDNGGIVSFSVDQRSSLLIGIGNAFFLQEILVPSFGSNAPLWSLSYEFWYYIMFPLGLAIFSRVSKIQRHCALLGLLGVAIFVGQTIVIYFLIWLMGAALYFSQPVLSTSSRKLFLMIASSLCLLLGLLFAIRNNMIGGVKSDFALAIIVFFFMYFLLHLKGHSGRWNIYNRIASTLAGFSYTLYLVHLPVLIFLRAWLLPSSRWQPDFLHLCLAAIVFMTVFLYAFLLSRMTEVKTDNLRQLIMAKVSLTLDGKRSFL
jgi:peptidoglycan/LPS O-acetylase OafA/YrhL